MSRRWEASQDVVAERRCTQLNILFCLPCRGFDSTWVSRDSALISVPGTGNFVLKMKQVRVTGNVSSALSTAASQGFARHWYKLLHLLHDGELADEQRGDCLLN